MSNSYQVRSETEIFTIIYYSIFVDLSSNKKRRLALFGGGQFAKRFLSVIRNKNLNIDLVAIIDDNAQPSQCIENIPVLASNSLTQEKFDAIFLCTDSIEEKLLTRVQNLYGKTFPVYRLSSLMEKNKITYKKAPVKIRKQPNLWQLAYDNWIAGNRCADFNDCIVLAAIWDSPAYYNEKNIEHSFIKDNFNFSSGKILDVGSKAFELPRTLVSRGFDVTCIDPNINHGSKDGIKLIRGDIRSTNWTDEKFNYIICMSTIEHIGDAGQNGIFSTNDDGDRCAIKEMIRMLKFGGQLFLTVPFGQVPIFPVKRTYTEKKILSMAKNLKVIQSVFYRPDGNGNAIKCSVDEANDNDWRRDGYYALGCYQFEK